MDKLICLRTLFLTAIAALLSACDKNGTPDFHNTQNTMTLEIRLRMNAAAELELRNPFLKVEAHPAGLDFYSVEWSPPNLGHITYGDNGDQFDIYHVFSVNLTEGLEGDNDSIVSKIQVNAGLGEDEFSSQSESREAFNLILTELLSKGWRGNLPFGAPRLTGRQRFIYASEANNTHFGFDNSYILNKEEWSALSTLTSWRLRKGDEYLEIMLMKNSSTGDSSAGIAYLVTFVFSTLEEELRKYIPSENKKDWKKLIRDVIEERAKTRSEREEKLEKLGFIIDRSYKDPEIKLNLNE